MKVLRSMLVAVIVLIMPSTFFAQMGQDDLIGFRNDSELPSNIFDNKDLVSLGSRQISEAEKEANQLTLTLPSSATSSQLFVLNPSNQLIVSTNSNSRQTTININPNEVGGFRYVFVSNNTVYLGEVINLE